MYIQTSKICLFKSVSIIEIVKNNLHSNLGKGEIIEKNFNELISLFPRHSYNYRSFKHFSERVKIVFNKFSGRRSDMQRMLLDNFGCISWKELSLDEKSKHDIIGTCFECGNYQLSVNPSVCVYVMACYTSVYSFN